MAATIESIPIVDLRLLSQADLTALAASSPDTVDLRRCDDVVPPRIDRSVFNESAGSRKQTFSRLRLAPRNADPLKPSPPPSASPTPPPPPPSSSSSRDNDLIIAALRRLFSPHQSQALAPYAPPPPPPPPISAPDPSPAPPRPSLSLQIIPAETLAPQSHDARDMETLNTKGAAVDLVALGAMDDPFSGELKRRTQGLITVDGLLGFMTGLDGQWGSRRKKKKIVDAASFGDHLPRGWMLLLGIRRKEGTARMDCRRYISPCGKRFKTCREVSTYILSLISPQGASHHVSSVKDVNESSLNLPVQVKVTTPAQFDRSTVKSSYSNDVPDSTSSHNPINNSFHKLKRVAKANSRNSTLECRKCNTSFADNDEYLQHLLTFHQRSAKRRKLITTISDGVIIKDGKYECQICHKSFTERRRYNGHVGSHVRYQGFSPGTMSNGSDMKVLNPAPLAVVYHIPPKNDASVDNEKSAPMLIAYEHAVDVQMFDSHPSQGDQEKDGVPESSQTSKAVDEQRNGYDATSSRSEESCGIKVITGPKEGSDFTSLSAIDLNGATSGNTSLTHLSDSDMNRHESCGIASKSDSADAINISSTACETSGKLSNYESFKRESVDGHNEDRELASIAPEEVRVVNSEAVVNSQTYAGLVSISHDNSDHAFSETTHLANESCSILSGAKEYDKNLKVVDSVDHVNVLSSVGGTFEGYHDEQCDRNVHKLNKLLVASSAQNAELTCSSPFSFSLNNNVGLSCPGILDSEKYNQERTIDFGSHLNTLSGSIVSNAIEHDTIGVNASMNDVCVPENACTIGLGDYLCNSHALSDKDADADCAGFDFDISNEQEIDIKGCGLSLLGNWISPSKESGEGGAFHNIGSVTDDELDCFSNATKTGFSEIAACNTTVINSSVDAINLGTGVLSSSWVSPSDFSTIDMIPDQCHYEANIHGGKHGSMLGSELLSMGRIEPSDLVLLSGQGSVPPSQRAMDLDLVLGGRYGCDDPPSQLEWVGMSPKVDSSCMQLGALCMWCGRGISLEDIGNELPADSVGFMCVECKARIPR